MTRTEMIAYLIAAGKVATEAVVHGHHPFGAILVGPDNRILMCQGNIDTCVTQRSNSADVLQRLTRLLSCGPAR